MYIIYFTRGHIPFAFRESPCALKPSPPPPQGLVHTQADTRAHVGRGPDTPGLAHLRADGRRMQVVRVSARTEGSCASRVRHRQPESLPCGARPLQTEPLEAGEGRAPAEGVGRPTLGPTPPPPEMVLPPPPATSGSPGLQRWSTPLLRGQLFALVYISAGAVEPPPQSGRVAPPLPGPGSLPELWFLGPVMQQPRLSL